MRTSLVAPFFALALVAASAGAASIQIEVPANIEPAKSQLTRAEVIADYHMWRLAGLEELNRGEQPVDAYSHEYQKALATYEYLRSSPQFASLVNQIEQNPNATVVAARPAAQVAQSDH